MRDRLIDVFTHLDEHISYKEEYGILFDTPFVKAVEDVLQMLNGVTVQEWISVKDRLPDKYRDEYGELIPFLVCESGTEYPCRALFDGKKWGDGVFLIPVTHWMPLPQPPKGE